MKKSAAMVLCLFLMTGVFIQSSAQEPVNIVTSFYPIYIFAQNILKDVEDVNLSNLTHPSTGCLHDYQLLAGDMVTLSQADAIIINGGGMENFLPMIVSQFPDLRVIDSSIGIELLYNEEHQQDHKDVEHEHQEGENELENAHEHEHDHGDFNAHIWLDPQNAIQMSLNIAQALKDLLPMQSERIDQNTAAYIKTLNDLDIELNQQLTSLAHREIVTFHEAFSYFAKAFDLQVVAVLALEPDESLTPQMLKTLVIKVRDANLPPLFTEPQYDDRAAKAVSQETGAAIYELDPVVTGDGAIDAYESVMRKNAQVLVLALGEK